MNNCTPEAKRKNPNKPTSLLLTGKNQIQHFKGYRALFPDVSRLNPMILA